MRKYVVHSRLVLGVYCTADKISVSAKLVKGSVNEPGWMCPIFARAKPYALFHRGSSVSNLSRSNSSVISFTFSCSGSVSASYLRFPPTRMDVTVVGSAAGFPLRLSLAPVLPLRFAEAKDSVPCRKLLDLVESRVLEELDLWGAMVVVVRVEAGMEC
jgi:hypothetical protein